MSCVTITSAPASMAQAIWIASSKSGPFEAKAFSSALDETSTGFAVFASKHNVSRSLSLGSNLRRRYARFQNESTEATAQFSPVVARVRAAFDAFANGSRSANMSSKTLVSKKHFMTALPPTQKQPFQFRFEHRNHAGVSQRPKVPGQLAKRQSVFHARPEHG